MTNITTQGLLCWTPNITYYSSSCYEDYNKTHGGTNETFVNTTWVSVQAFENRQHNCFEIDFDKPFRCCTIE